MLDFRKFFLALALLAIAAGMASAQVVFQTPPSCTAQAAGTPSIRAEGVAELVGDVLLICTGGTPTADGAQVPQVNIQVFSSPSINITSRILGGGGVGSMTEALLFVDEPTQANQTICGGPATGNTYTVPLGSGQQVITGVCGLLLGTGNGVNTYAGGTNRPNAFQARTAGANSLIWQGVPFDPPGTNTTRILRITNVRVNASQLGVPAGSQASVSLVISTSASGVSNPIALPITNPAPTVAIAQTSLDFSVVDAVTCLQCESANKSFAGDPTAALASGTCQGSQLVLRFQERFPTVFRRRSQVIPTGNDTTPTTSQDNLGFIYQTETGFFKNPTTANPSNWPATVSTLPAASGSMAVSGTAGGTLGLADTGTRIIARVSNVQNGVQLWVPTQINLVSPQAGGTVTGRAILVTSDPNGAGPLSPTPAGTSVNPPSGGTGGMGQISVVGGTGAIVYEILQTDTTAIERLQIPVVIAYVSNTSSNLPALGASTANGNLAPISTVATASATAPLPRFVDTAASRTLLTINSCRTNILFPFVTNQGGFDTGLAIANTSLDPFGTSPQTGACTVNFYGYVGNSKVNLAYPSPSITGGEHFVWSLSSGGAVTATAGFQGYVIAQCAFQYGHGYAFISDVGAQRLAMGYLALVMDDALAPSRTGSKSEVLGH
ncbi:MAG: hypothetical protein IT168_30525 [Bryobacterales bacterium]|nr:hypothetical protein [Bryobacterales bacterium]